MDEPVEHLAGAAHVLEHERAIHDVVRVGLEFNGPEIADDPFVEVTHLVAPSA